MKYYNSDFATECVHLRRCPLTAAEAHNKLICLCELEQRFDPNANILYVLPLSKRRKRLVNMFWAFRNTEQKIKAVTI